MISWAELGGRTLGLTETWICSAVVCLDGFFFFVSRIRRSAAPGTPQERIRLARIAKISRETFPVLRPRGMLFGGFVSRRYCAVLSGE